LFSVREGQGDGGAGFELYPAIRKHVLNQTETTTPMCRIYKTTGSHFLFLSLSSVYITVFAGTISNQKTTRKRKKCSVTLGQLNGVTSDFRVLLKPSIHFGGFHFLTEGTLPETCVL